MVDTLLFVPPIFVQGYPRGSFNKQQATVISVDPDAEDCRKVEISSGDMLENSHQVMRIKILKKGKLVSHPGTLRMISSFVLEKQTAYKGEALNLRAEQLGNTI